jgi:hypothetical protein
VTATIVNAMAAAIIIAPSRIRLALVPGRYAVAIAVAALLPFVFRSQRLSIGIVLGLSTLTIIPSLFAKLVFNVPTPWLIVTLLNAVYALTALIVYCDWSTAAQLLTPRKFAIDRGPTFDPKEVCHRPRPNF